MADTPLPRGQETGATLLLVALFATAVLAGCGAHSDEMEKRCEKRGLAWRVVDFQPASASYHLRCVKIDSVLTFDDLRKDSTHAR